MREMFDNVVTFVTDNWVLFVIALCIIVLINFVWYIISKISKASKKKKAAAKKSKETVIHAENVDEEKKNLENKITFLEARVKELEVEVQRYEQEASDAKMSTLNLTSALEDLQKNVGNDHPSEDIGEEIVDEVETEEPAISIVNINDEALEQENVVEKTVSDVEEVKEQPIVEETTERVSAVEEAPVVEETPVVEEKPELPQKLVDLRNAIHQNIQKINAEYSAIDENTPTETVDRIKSELEKAKKQLEQYKTIASKYKS